MHRGRDSILQSLHRLRPTLAERYGVRVIGIVGSWARGDAREDSDLDVAFDLVADHKVSLFDLGGAAAEIEDEIGLRIDLVDWRMVRPAFRPGMERDLVPILPRLTVSDMP